MTSIQNKYEEELTAHQENEETTICVVKQYNSVIKLIKDCDTDEKLELLKKLLYMEKIAWKSNEEEYYHQENEEMAIDVIKQYNLLIKLIKDCDTDERLELLKKLNYIEKIVWELN